MLNKKRIESIYSSVDIGINSILTFITFIIVKQYLGIDVVGFFGLVLSIAAFGETIQQGLYENPVFLNFGVGYKNFQLKISSLALVLVLPILVVDRLFMSGYFISSLLYCLSHVLLHNIRVYDYKNNDVPSSTSRSIGILLLQLTFFYYVVFYLSEFNLNTLLIGISLIRIIYIVVNKRKVFFYKDTEGNGENLNFLITALLTIIRSRLPLWLLLPFGLGLVGIFETFRTILEIFLTPSRPVVLILLKNINRDGPNNILRFGLICGLVSSAIVSISYFQILKFEIYNIPELISRYPYIAVITITFCYWISEVTGIIFQSNGELLFESKRRLIPIIFFITTGLTAYQLLNLNVFLLLISIMYILEVLISIIYKDKLSLN
jgi:hypothetical protein